MNPSWIKIFAIFAWVGIGIFNVEPALSSNFNIVFISTILFFNGFVFISIFN